MATEGNLVSLARRGGDVPGEHQYNFVNNTRDREEKNKDMGDKRENAEEEEARGSAAGYLLERMFRWWHGLLRQLWRRRHVALVRTAAFHVNRHVRLWVAMLDQLLRGTVGQHPPCGHAHPLLRVKRLLDAGGIDQPHLPINQPVPRRPQRRPV